MAIRILSAGALALALLTTPALANDSTTYTLYRNTETNTNARVHIATFDSDGGSAYNRESCQLVSDLLQLQPGIKTIFWCEAGRVRR